MHNLYAMWPRSIYTNIMPRLEYKYYARVDIQIFIMHTCNRYVSQIVDKNAINRDAIFWPSMMVHHAMHWNNFASCVHYFHQDNDNDNVDNCFIIIIIHPHPDDDGLWFIIIFDYFITVRIMIICSSNIHHFHPSPDDDGVWSP